jgi:sulfate adenylyltransferase
MEDGLIPPHGGTLIDLIAEGEEARRLADEAASLPKLALSARALSDLELLSVGGFSPLKIYDARGLPVRGPRHALPDELAWSLPSSRRPRESSPGRPTTAHRPDGRRRRRARPDGGKPGVRYDKGAGRLCYKTTDQAHPGVAAVYQQDPMLLGGPVQVFKRVSHEDFQEYRLEPTQTRAAFRERGWRTVVGFQTRNPVHRAHEYIQKCAMETVVGKLPACR